MRAWLGGTDEFAGVFGGLPLCSSSSAIRACNRTISSIGAALGNASRSAAVTPYPSTLLHFCQAPSRPAG